MVGSAGTHVLLSNLPIQSSWRNLSSDVCYVEFLHYYVGKESLSFFEQYSDKSNLDNKKTKKNNEDKVFQPIEGRECRVVKIAEFSYLFQIFIVGIFMSACFLMIEILYVHGKKQTKRVRDRTPVAQHI